MSKTEPKMSDLILRRFVAGMRWQPVLSDQENEAKRRALQERANWFHFGINPNGDARFVGVANLPKKERPAKDERFYSLARLAAKQAQFGTCFVAIALPEDTGFGGHVWVAMLTAGSPVGDCDAIVNEMDAPSKLDAFCVIAGTSVDAISIHGNASGLPRIDSSFTWEELTSAAEQELLLAALKPTQLSLSESISPGTKNLLGVVVLGVILLLAYDQYSAWRKKRAAALEAANQQVDPVAEWRETINRWQLSKRGPDSEALPVLRSAMATVPALIQGWKLLGFQCSLGDAAWACTAKYERPKNTPEDPTSSGFYAARPKEWVVEPKSLEIIEAHFRLPVPHTRLNMALAKSVDWHMDHSASELQVSMRAFNSVSMTSFAAVQLTPPTGPSGGPIARPTSVKLPAIAIVTLNGPLRSVDLNSIRDLPVAWKTAHVALDLGAKSPSLTTSAINVELKGEIYAIQ